MPARVSSSPRRYPQKLNLLVESLERRVLLAVTTLSNGTGDGTLSIPVDAYGSYADAFYDPVGDVGSVDTTYFSGLYPSTFGEFLSEDEFTSLPPIDFPPPTAGSAVSSFSSSGLS